MEQTTNPSRTPNQARLLDENEQLKTALESALDENARLTEDRDLLLQRVGVLGRELQAASAARMPVLRPSVAGAEATQSETDEELRVAFEEMQMLTEELEVANTSLHFEKAQLERRVLERTRELQHSNAELRRSEARFRTLIEGMPQLVWRASGIGEWTWSSPQWSEYTGLTAEESSGVGWMAAIHPDDRARAAASWEAAAKSHKFDFEGRVCHAGERRYRHFHTRALPALGAKDEVLEWLGTSTDVDDLVRLQQQQVVLVDELQHRTRNLMAVLQAITLRTIRDSDSLEHFRRCIDDRMQALARVQGLLSRRDAHLRVTFDALLREELTAHVQLDASGNGPHVTTSGPAGIPLRPTTVQTFALALHELATNAIKYGALKHPDGHLTVTWKVAEEDEKPYLYVDWLESGGTKLIEVKERPRRFGYGRELIERALPYQMGARTSFAFTDDGVHCTIRVLVPQDDAPQGGGR